MKVLRRRSEKAAGKPGSAIRRWLRVARQPAWKDAADVGAQRIWASLVGTVSAGLLGRKSRARGRMRREGDPGSSLGQKGRILAGGWRAEKSLQSENDDRAHRERRG